MTRAQEAEENYVIKRELAVVRQQCSSAAEDLQKAQSTIRQLQEQQVPGRATSMRLHSCPAWQLLSGLTSNWLGISPSVTIWGSGGGTQSQVHILPQPHPQQSTLTQRGILWFPCSITLRGAWPSTVRPRQSTSSGLIVGTRLSLQGPLPGTGMRP